MRSSLRYKKSDLVLQNYLEVRSLFHDTLHFILNQFWQYACFSFLGSEPEPEPVPQSEPSVPTEEKPAETSQEQKEEANNINKEKPEHDNKENVGKPETNETDKVANQTDKEPAKNGTEKIEKKPKVIVIKENITSSHEEFGVPSLTDAQFQNAAKKFVGFLVFKVMVKKFTF